MATVSINTFPRNNAVAPMGGPQPTRSSAYAQSFVAPGGPMGTIMQSMRFEIQRNGTLNVFDVKAYVYQWNPLTRVIVGPALFASAPFTINSTAFTMYTIPVNVTLTSGVDYVAFFSVLDNNTGIVIAGNVPPYSSTWGFRTGNAYPFGKYFFQNNGSFAQYFVQPWGQFASLDDLAFEFIFQNIVCIHPDMKVELKDGTIKLVKDIKEGDLLKTANFDIPSKVMVNHRNPIKHKNLVRIDKDALGPNMPSEPLLLASTHPIVINGVYIKAKQLINKETIKKVKCPIHTHVLVTDLGFPVIINGCEVGTWKFDKWTKGIKIVKS